MLIEHGIHTFFVLLLIRAEHYPKLSLHLVFEVGKKMGRNHGGSILLDIVVPFEFSTIILLLI